MSLTPTKRLALALIAAAGIAGCCEPLPCKMPATTPSTEPPPPELPQTPAELAPIPMVVLPEADSATVSFRFSFTAGSAHDASDKRGQALLTAWLMAEGGAGQLSATELKQRLFPMAASIGVSVDKEQTVFYGRVLAADAEAYYELLRDVLIAPTLAARDFERLRGQASDSIASGLRGSNDEELGKAALDLVLYAGHPYASPVAGSVSGLKALTLADLNDFRERHLCRNRLTIGLSGQVSPALQARAREDMEQLPVERCEPLPALSTLTPPESRKVLLVDKPEAPATAISIGFPLSVRRGEPDYAALKLVEAYFGQHRTFMGRLQKRLRVERGLNYGNYAYVEHFEQEGQERVPSVNVSRRQQAFTIWLRPVKDADKHFALRLALYELEQLVTQGISQAQLDTTRTFVKGYYPGFAQTQSRRLGYALDDQFYAAPGAPAAEYFDSLLSQIDALTPEVVNAAIRRHLTKNKLYIAVVTRDASAFADALASDAPSPIVYASAKAKELSEEDAIVSKLPLGIAKPAITVVSASTLFE